MSVYAPTYCPGTKCDPCAKGLIGTANVAIGSYGDQWLGASYSVQVNILITWTMSDSTTETTTVTVSEPGFTYGGSGTASVAVSQPLSPPAGFISYTITSPSAYVVFGGPGGTFLTTADVSGLTIQ